MKILFINNLFGEFAKGGAERVVEARVKEAISEGHEVIVLTSCPRLHVIPAKAGIQKLFNFFPLNICHYTTMMRLWWPIRFVWHALDTFSVHSFFVVWLLLKKEKPDEIHTHNLKGIGLLSVLAIRLSKIKWIHTVHDVQLITPSGLIIYGKEYSFEHKNFLTIVYRALCRLFFDSPHEVRFPSEWLKRFYDNYNFLKNSSKVIIPNRCIIFLEPRTCNLKPNLFIYSGQLEPHKGVSLLIEVFRKLPDKKLHVYGTGTLLQSLRDSTRDFQNIVFFGKVSAEKMHEAYQTASCLLYPSVCYENAPMSIVEAKAFGLRVIASNIGGIPELLDAHDFLITPGNAEVLFQTIINFSSV